MYNVSYNIYIIDNCIIVRERTAERHSTSTVKYFFNAEFTGQYENKYHKWFISYHSTMGNIIAHVYP